PTFSTVKGYTLSVNHTLPSGPAVSPLTDARVSPRKNVAIRPSGVTRLMDPVNASVANHTFPSGPAVMALPAPREGPLAGEGGVNSVAWPAGGMRPTVRRAGSVNQRLPSGPAVMAPG